jgi:hypothetical protein
MGIPQETKKRWSAEITLGAADTTKTLVAAPGLGTTAIVCTHLVARILVAAAQDVDIKIGSVNLRRLKASEVVGTESFFGPMIQGIVGQAGQALTISPAAAGPSVHVVAEGYYEGQP